MLSIGPLKRRSRLTLVGRASLLIVLEIIANVAVWTAAGLLFGRSNETRGTLSLALLAWTIGLRHGLDADHISAIDNATSGLISLGQLPVTCGLFFSLGHSTIVIVVNIAVAVSTKVYDKISNVSNVGGIIGAAVSGSFLFIIGLANSFILFKIIKNRRRRQEANIENASELHESGENSIMMKVLGPVTKFVNKPWKMYPVGVLFGLGFDTASSIALLAVSALAERDADGKGIPRADIVVLPFLFTAGMTLVDSVDSILMLYAYAGISDRSFVLFERRLSSECVIGPALPIVPEFPDVMKPAEKVTTNPNLCGEVALEVQSNIVFEDEAQLRLKQRTLRVKQHTMSGLSIALTLVSILVAFSISLITIMGLISENCASCQRAAESPDSGLAGSWWRGWSKANEDSGFIGAAIVGGFVLIIASWYGGSWILKKTKKQPHILSNTHCTQS